MFHSLAGAIIQIHMRQHNIFIRDRIHIHSKSVILSGDVDQPGRQVLHRLIAAMMPEL